MKRIITFTAFMLFLILMVAALTGCDHQGYYKGEEPDLHTIAMNSLVGVAGREDDGIIVLEEDAYGRKLFAFIGPSIFSAYYMNKESEHNNMVALLIAQSTIKNRAYYYDSVNFIVAKAIQDKWPYEYTANEVRDCFSNSQIDNLKNTNDWGKPFNKQKCFSIATSWQKTNPLSRKAIRAANGQVTDSVGGAIDLLLTRDSEGKYLYFMLDVGKEDIKGAYLFMFNMEGELIEETGIYKLTNLWDYQDELYKFKVVNGWEFCGESALTG